MMTQTIRIGGMTCVNCQTRIEKKLECTAGVTDIQVDYNNGTARLAWNPALVTLDQIHAAIEELGYEVLPEGAKNPAYEIAGT
ncbi:MAG: cation transporter, partial [Spirochaetaceae bacterium]|nr:cation transporter [Spirochaetaceae bacterium]